jgi:hypothetical protein
VAKECTLSEEMTGDSRNRPQRGSCGHHMINCMGRWKSSRTPLPQGMREGESGKVFYPPSGPEGLLKGLFFLFQMLCRRSAGSSITNVRQRYIRKSAD